MLALPSPRAYHAAVQPFSDTAAARACVERHGSHSLAFSALQPGMRYFGDPACGCIAYRAWLGQTCVLGDPIASGDGAPALLDTFLEWRGKAIFMQIHTKTATLLRARGYRITPVGVENEIDTATFSLDGKRKRDLRHYQNKARKTQVLVEERADTAENRTALLPVSRGWLPIKSWFSRELEFLARPFVTDPEPGARLFTASCSGRDIAFTVLDPMYMSGKPAGYTVSILRHLPDAPEGACDYINFHVARRLREEGVPLLSLGVSPFHQMEALARAEGAGAWPVYLTYRALRRWGDPIYHFRGLSFHKSRYRAREVPVYTAVPGPLGLLPLFASAKACRML